MGSTASPVLELRDVRKRFGRAEVLRGVSLVVRAGEVHALAGENGAGKSTLVKIVCGAHRDFDGELRLGGAVRRFESPLAARRAGVATIHQELSLVGAMTVADNLALGRGDARAFARYDARAARSHAARLLAELGLAASPDDAVEDLPFGAQQLVEIARALAEEASLFVLDEPTSALGDAEAERLFAFVERLRDRGKGVLFVSHRTGDLERLADTITVLCDGKVALSRPYADVTQPEVLAAMLGERAADVDADLAHEAEAARARVTTGRAERLRLDGARAIDAAGRVVAEASLAVAAGEIVGLAGLRGAGASALLSALAGDTHRLDGDVRLDGERARLGSPRAALRHGIGFVPADRQRAAVVPELSVTANATLASLPRWSPRGVLDRAAERRAVAGLAASLYLARVDADAPLGTLSGGSQQKIVLARALLAAPRVLLLDEPTRGVDVAAKADIHRLLREQASRGLAVVFASTDAEELFALADRVVVFARGRVAADLARPDATREAVLAAAMGAAS
ncbi:MAG TPA: sugar ABC transporter ATP-binding protein [Minicystis sp.]|nr:sugar ABC transporter ATP-binding protein [Minicystis sp.]